MFYSFIVFIIAILFLVRTNHKNHSSQCMIAVLFSYMMALFFLAMYLSKDTYYYSTMNHYFALPKFIWRILLLLPVQKNMIIRLCNFASLCVIASGVLFSLSFSHPSLLKISPAIKKTTICALLLELVFYDPAFTKKLYYFLYPNILSVKEFGQFQQIAHIITISINCFFLFLSIFFLMYTLIKTSGLRIIRINILWTSVSYTFILLSYAFIFMKYPCFMTKISKLAGIETYLNAPLPSSDFLYILFPYFMIFTVLSISFSIYRNTRFNSQLQEQDFSISKQIAASDITSRTFCHYMKNELLAIQAELDTLECSGETARAIQNVVERCNYLYQRLDTIHRNTHAASLILHKESLPDVMHALCERCLASYADITVTYDFPEHLPLVLIDRCYFEQAIMNLITNAVEAVEKVPEDRRNILIGLSTVDQWIVLTIRDTGIGIPKELLPHIFTPFFTSEPIARHWGIGLSLTHKVISAHEGHIEVRSIPEQGTTFSIMIPLIQPK